MPYIKQDRRTAIDHWLRAAFAEIHGSIPAGRGATPKGAGMPKDCGELNYAMTMTCINDGRQNFGALDARLDFIGKAWLLGGEELRYQRINDLVGACECAALELQRRRPTLRFEVVTLRHMAAKMYSEIGVGYELKKIAENGDIDYGEARDVQALKDKREGTTKP